MTTPLYLCAPSAVGRTENTCSAADFEQALRLQTGQQCGQQLRQASHFIRLAVAPALSSARAGQMPPEGGVYLGTGLGDLCTAAALFHQVAAGSGRPSPFDFVNVNNNTAAYYIARIAGLTGPNLTVTQGILSFEWALALAVNDLAGGLSHALVGGVDEMGLPPEDQARRFHVNAGQCSGEGSGWVVVTRERSGACARFIKLCWVRVDSAAWIEEVRAHCLAVAAEVPIRLLPGLGVDSQILDLLVKALPNLRPEPFLGQSGAYPTVAAWAVASCLKAVQCPGIAMHMSVNGRGDSVLLFWETLGAARL